MKVSVITPCYNGEQYVEQYISNILCQSIEELELIFVNDGSTDNTEQLIGEKSCKLLARQYKFVYVEKNNGGLVSAINAGLERVSGEYIMLLDMDDILFRDSVLHKMNFLEDHPDYGMVISNGFYSFPDTKRHDTPFTTRKKIPGNLFEEYIRVEIYNWPGSYMVRASFLWEIYPDRKIYNTKYGQNLQIVMPMSYYYKTGFINEYLMRYCVRKNSMSHSGDFEKMYEYVQGYHATREKMVEMIKMPEDEKQKYQLELRKYYLESILHFTCKGKNRELAKQTVNEMKGIGIYTISNHFFYELSRFDIFLYSYRIWNRLYMKINRKVI